ncbi:MAG: 4Fe-4S ferredoxin [Geobacteraceae bacterium GWB2_52_12]|nr:MAG: 4Fe-4S ferredoxin [Geobacteraceae bacterium GWB2_52_12]
MPKVFFTDMRTGHKENLFDKIARLLAAAGLPQAIAEGDLTAVKIHFGEKGNHTYLRPVFARKVVDEIKKLGALPFLTDSSTLYPGQRKEAVSALICAVENGFDYSCVGAPLIISDGLRGVTESVVTVDGELLHKAYIGTEIIEADSIVTMTHFKCHELTGFGGAIKNIGMGCASRKGKLVQHSTVAPKVSEKGCIGCGICPRSCAHDAIVIVNGKACIDPEKCTGCSRCITVCPVKAINIQWNEAADLVMRKMAEYAKAALTGKEGKAIYISFITQVSPACDCYGHSDAPIVNDIGICVSTDPVAIDQACADLVNEARGNEGSALQSGHEPGGDKFRGCWPDIPWEVQLEHGEKIGLGSRIYELVRI